MNKPIGVDIVALKKHNAERIATKKYPAKLNTTALKEQIHSYGKNMAEWRNQLNSLGSTYTEAALPKVMEEHNQNKPDATALKDKLTKRINELTSAKAAAPRLQASTASPEDWQYFSMPVVLEQSELNELVARNSNDTLFCRAADAYAEKNNIYTKGYEKQIVNPYDASIKQLNTLLGCIDDYTHDYTYDTMNYGARVIAVDCEFKYVTDDEI